MKKYSIIILGILTILILFAISSCLKDEDENSDQLTTYSKDIGPEGGTILTPEGFELNIPAEALLENVNISIEPFLTANDLLSSSDLQALYYISGMDLKPDGLIFNKPVSETAIPPKL